MPQCRALQSRCIAEKVAHQSMHDAKPAGIWSAHAAISHWQKSAHVAPASTAASGPASMPIEAGEHPITHAASIHAAHRAKLTKPETSLP